jgi:hypothetical protein
MSQLRSRCDGYQDASPQNQQRRSYKATTMAIEA